MNTHVYILTENSMANSYGVGQYVSLLIDVLKEKNILVSVVVFSSDKKNVTVEYVNFVRYIFIPIKCSIDYQKIAFHILYLYIDKNTKPIFHLNFECCEVLACLLKKYFPFSKVILTIHYSLSAIGMDRNKVIEMERNLINNYCDKVIAISDHRVNYLINECGICKSKIELMYHGIYDYYNQTVLKKNNIREWLGLNHKRIISYVGRLDESKGIVILLDAFERILSEIHNVHLVVVGDGYMLKPLLNKYKHLLAHITFVGFWSKDNIYQLYAETTLGIIPSKTEELGFVALEMMMFGIPIIANDTTGLRDILSQSQAGILLKLNFEDKEKSVILLMSSIIELLNNRIKQKFLSQEARQLFLKNFMINQFRSRLCKVYEI